MRLLYWTFIGFVISNAVLFAQDQTGKLIAKPDAFSTLVNPDCSHCADEAKRRAKELKDSDRVLCWTRGKYDGGAIPMRFFLNPYRVISDTYGVFVYDPDAGYARAFKASLDYRFHGWHNGIMVMKHKDGTIFSCLSGKAIDGPRKGEKLTPWPSIVTDWGWYMKSNPNGVAYHMYEKYKPTELPTTIQEDSKKSRGRMDSRLPNDEMVLGVIPPNEKANPKAYRVSQLDKDGCFHLLNDTLEDGTKVVVLWQGCTTTGAAYHSIAEKRKPTSNLSEEGEWIESKVVSLKLDTTSEMAPFRDEKTKSRFDVAGRCVDGELKGYTLKTFDSLMVKWYAWAAEFPRTTLFEVKTSATSKNALKEIAGNAEFLRGVPKHFATLMGLDPEKNRVTLLIEGEKVAKTWSLTPDSEIKYYGWWGRLNQFQEGMRVWVWFTTNRKKEPQEVFMLADEITQQDIHGTLPIFKEFGKGTVKFQNGKQGDRDIRFREDLIKGFEIANLKSGNSFFVQTKGNVIETLVLDKQFESLRTEQQKYLRKEWIRLGLPGTVSFVHLYSGESEIMLDHESMRWARSLNVGDEIQLHIPKGSNSIEKQSSSAVIKTVTPWRERTQIRVVLNSLDQTELRAGQRILVKMKTPSQEIEESPYPSDIDRRRTKEERIEWFLANTYCTCKIGNDTCTGHFFTLASCNPNGCASPNATRQLIREKIDKGFTDKQIFDDLRAERGPLLMRPHLLP